VRVAGLLKRKKKDVLKRVMLLPAAKGLMAVKGVKAPPLKLPVTLAEAMLSRAPSVNAAAGLVKYAYSVTVPKAMGSTQCVVMLTGELLVEAPLGRRAKLTDPGAAVIVMELFSVALRFTLAVLEFSCAPVLKGIRANAATANNRGTPLYPRELFFRAALYRELKLLFLESRKTGFNFTTHNRIFAPRVHGG
jgi:hypothetical protein